MAKKAFTLLEVLVISIIMSIVLAGTGSFIIMGTRLTDETNLEAQAQSILNTVIADLNRTIKQGTTIEYAESIGGNLRNSKFKIEYERPGSLVPEIIAMYASVTNQKDYHVFYKYNSTQGYKAFEYPGVKTMIYCIPTVIAGNELGETYSVRFEIFVELENSKGKKFRSPQIEFSVKTRNNRIL